MKLYSFLFSIVDWNRNQEKYLSEERYLVQTVLSKVWWIVDGILEPSKIVISQDLKTARLYHVYPFYCGILILLKTYQIHHSDGWVENVYVFIVLFQNKLRII